MGAVLTLDDAYRYLIGLPAGDRVPCPCGYPERWLAPANLAVLGIATAPGYVVLCPSCGELVGAIIER